MKQKKIRYAVVGLGYISQAAVLPAFEHTENSELTALVSDDPVKLEKLGRRYKVPYRYSYKQYEACLQGGVADAVYIALPNSLHCDYAIRAARAGLHVLCEKPMAVTEEECQAMIQAANQNDVKLMVAYRLHFEAANLMAIDLIKKGKIGEPRYFISSFGQSVKEGDIRLDSRLGGGSVYDMGIYCINAVRYLFQEEPVEAMAFSASLNDARFQGVDEMTSGLLRFPGERLASFTSSLGGGDTSYYRVVGTRGDIVLEPAYEYSEGLKLQLTVDGKKTTKAFTKTDQFAPELIYFSRCIQKDQEPEPSGAEGLIDVRIIQALYHSARTHAPVPLEPFIRDRRPSRQQEIKRPPVRKMPELIHAASPSGQ